MGKKILIIAGEPSADLHASRLVAAVRKADPSINFSGTGGDAMAAAGVKLFYHIRELSILGFVEVIRHLSFMRRVMGKLCQSVAQEKPGLIILIDYPGFNLRFARRIKKDHSIPILYYISPQVWAWGKGRIAQMRRLIDRLVVILPFEKEFFKQHGLDADYVGHPLTESVKPTLEKDRFYDRFGLDRSLPLLGLLPGSRHQEVSKILPVMLQTCALVNRQQKIQAIVAGSPNVDPKVFSRIISRAGQPVTVCPGLSYDVMQHADLVLTASGSATLETAWLGTPMIILYRVSPLTWLLGKWLVKLPYIGLVNVVAGKKIIPEYLQGNMQPDQIAPEALRLLTDRNRYNGMVGDLHGVRQQLGTGHPSEAAAAIVAEMLA